MDLAKKLKQARENAGLSQNDVATKLNISRQSISRWENGWSYPDIENLVLLSDMYKVSIDELLKDQEEKSLTEDNHESDVFEKIEHLFMISIAILSCTVPIAGLFLNIGIFVYCYIKKIKLKPMYRFVIGICVVINIFNIYTMLSVSLPNIGKGHIEKISN